MNQHSLSFECKITTEKCIYPIASALIYVTNATSHADTVNETLPFHGPKDILY